VPPSPLPSYVHLNISCNVVVVKPGAVLATMERAIHIFSRPMDPDHEMGDQQVCVMMSLVTPLRVKSCLGVGPLNGPWVYQQNSAQ
jgi:hypothetical protein